MGKIQRGLCISAIVEFFIAVVCAIIIYLNKEQIINIQFKNIKMVALLAIVLCLLVLIEEFVQIIFVGGKIVKKGYHNIKYCDDELFNNIDKYTYCYKENNLYYINIIRIINLYYRDGGPIDNLVKDNQIEKLLLRNDFLHKQKNLFDEIMNLFSSFAISIIVALLGGKVMDDNSLITVVSVGVMVCSFFVIFYAKYVYRGQGGTCLNQIYEYEISKLEEKILKLQNTLEISNENAKYIYTQHIALKELIQTKNKNRKNKTIIDDINQLSNINLCMENREDIYDRKLYINNQEVYFAYRKSKDDCKKDILANEEFEKLYMILKKYNLIDFEKSLDKKIPRHNKRIKDGRKICN